MEKIIIINGKVIELIFEFPILYEGWECDSTGWIGKLKNDSKVIVLSSHGSFYIGKENELIEKIEEYEKAITKTKEALEIYKGK